MRADEDGDDEPEDLDSSERRLVDPRSVRVRFSFLKQMARSALHYLHACQAKSDDETLARKLGTFTHAMVLGQPVAPWTKKTSAGKSSPRSGKDFDKHKADNPGAVYPNSREYREAKGMADALRSHPIAAAMLYPAADLPAAIREHAAAQPFLHAGGSQLELELNWRYLDRDCQSHLDVYRRGAFVADVKTADDGNPEWFPFKARRFHYYAQLAMYVECVEALGHPTPKPYIILVESSPPYPVTVLEVTPRALEAGRRQIRLWFEQLLACEAAGSWQGYSQCVEPLDLPGDQGEAFEDAAA